MIVRGVLGFGSEKVQKVYEVNGPKPNNNIKNLLIFLSKLS